MNIIRILNTFILISIYTFPLGVTFTFNIKYNISFNREEKLEVVNYHSLFRDHPSSVVLGGLNKYFNITFNDKDKYNIQSHILIKNNETLSTYREECLYIYRSSEDCDYYVKVLKQLRYKTFICISNRHTTNCFYRYNNNTKITDIISINRSLHNIDNIIFTYSKGYKCLFISMNTPFILNIFHLGKYDIKYKQIANTVGENFIYSFIRNQKIFFLINQIEYVHGQFSHVGKILQISPGDNKFIGNQNILNCSFKVSHETYNNLHSEIKFPKILSSIYFHDYSVVFVTFIDRYSSYYEKYELSTNIAVCMFKMDEENNVKPEGKFLFNIPNSNTISMEILHNYLYILRNKLDDNDNKIIQRYQINNDNNRIEIIKDNNFKVLVPFEFDKIYIIALKHNKSLFMGKENNNLIFYNFIEEKNKSISSSTLMINNDHPSEIINNRNNDNNLQIQSSTINNSLFPSTTLSPKITTLSSFSTSIKLPSPSTIKIITSSSSLPTINNSSFLSPPPPPMITLESSPIINSSSFLKFISPPMMALESSSSFCSNSFNFIIIIIVLTKIYP